MNRIEKEIIKVLRESGVEEARIERAIKTLAKRNVYSHTSGKGWDSKFVIKKYANKEDFKANRVYSQDEAVELFGTGQECVIEKPGNLLLNEGITIALNLMTSTGSTPTAWSNAAAYIGVGDSSTAESATQTALQAATNKLWKGMDSTYPQVSNQTATWQATFTGAEANYAWNEFTIVNASTDTGQNLCRKVSAQGTKTAGQIWTIIYTVTLS